MCILWCDKKRLNNVRPKIDNNGNNNNNKNNQMCTLFGPIFHIFNIFLILILFYFFFNSPRVLCGLLGAYKAKSGVKIVKIRYFQLVLKNLFNTIIQCNKSFCFNWRPLRPTFGTEIL